MNPKLTAISGPLATESFPLTGEEFSIGREISNDLPIEDNAVSRRHCLIRKEGDRFKINDLESYNGTFVNDTPTKEHLLEHGDRIKIGKSLFVFLCDETDELPASSPLQIDTGSLTTGSTIRLSIENAFSSMARDLSALMKISTTINSISDLETLQRQLLELIFEVLPADRGAVILMEEGSEEPTSSFALDRISGPGRTVQVSRTVLRQVVRERTSILSNDVLESDDLGKAQSLVASSIKSLLCVPLLLVNRILGVIYLDTSNPMVSFDEGQLKLITAIAGIAAVALENARRMAWLEGENRRLQADIQLEHNMVGESAPMREVYQLIAKVALSDSTILILGESGTGKELAARAIHQNSRRAGRPFVAINCAALTDTLLESEIFGHEKGAFTGAISQKKGKLEVADGGTVFLDEVGELASALQAKLLRVLQEREFERVGGTRPVRVDIRLIAATNRNLDEAIKDGGFRQDLYYRLNVISLTMPPLKERREDISLLASYFASKYSKKTQRHIIGISTEARMCLLNYEWPGNVRELENAIERAVVLGSTELILPEDLPEAVLETEPPAGGDVPIAKYHETINEAKKRLIIKAVEQANGNYTEAAKLLGLQATYLHRLIRNMNLKEALKK